VSQNHETVTRFPSLRLGADSYNGSEDSSDENLFPPPLPRTTENAQCLAALLLSSRLRLPPSFLPRATVRPRRSLAATSPAAASSEATAAVTSKRNRLLTTEGPGPPGPSLFSYLVATASRISRIAAAISETPSDGTISGTTRRGAG